MRKITILLVIIFTLLFSTTSWGEWNYLEEIKGEKNSASLYYDRDRIRKSGKVLYFWLLHDFEKLSDGKYSSKTTYLELDCLIFRVKVLKVNGYYQSMGQGNIGYSRTIRPVEEIWEYPPPNTVQEFVYNKICQEHQ